MIDDPVHVGSMSDEALIEEFIRAAKLARSWWTGFQPSSPERAALVSRIRAVGKELGNRDPARSWTLLDHPDDDVRGWAASKLDVNESWALAALGGLQANISTSEALALMDYAWSRPRFPPAREQTDESLLAYYKDVANRLFATLLMNIVQEPDQMELHNEIAIEKADIVNELERRGRLDLLLELLDHPWLGIQSIAAQTCMWAFPDKSLPILEKASDAIYDDLCYAKMALSVWKQRGGVEANDPYTAHRSVDPSSTEP
jgi:hypothetical protein